MKDDLGAGVGLEVTQVFLEVGGSDGTGVVVHVAGALELAAEVEERIGAD